MRDHTLRKSIIAMTEELQDKEEYIKELELNISELLEVLKLAYSNLGATAISEHTFTSIRAKMQQVIVKNK